MLCWLAAHPPVFPDECYVCPRDEEICNPDATVILPPGDVVACKNLEETAELRGFTAEKCWRYKEENDVEHVCGCEHTCYRPPKTPTKAPTPHPSEF